MKNLIGFLSSNGTFTECDSYGHMSKAENIAKSNYKKEFKNGYEAEQFLYEKGYVGFYARSVGFKFLVGNDNNKRVRLLSDKQRDFIINNLSNANNMDQQKDMEGLLEFDDGYRNENILHYFENNIQG